MTTAVRSPITPPSAKLEDIPEHFIIGGALAAGPRACGAQVAR